MSQRAKLALAVLIGANVFALIGVGGLLLFNSDLRETFLGIFRPGGSIQIDVSVPPSVAVGDTFEVVVEVTNSGDGYIKVDEILLPDALLDAALVTRVFPGTLNLHHYQGMTGYQIDFTLEPDEKRPFQLTLEARAPADISADLWVIAGSVNERVGTRFVLVEPDQNAGAGIDHGGSSPQAEIPYQSVVKITAMYREGGRMLEGWSGSGTIVTQDGLILTNAHVVLPDKFFPVDALLISITEAADQDPVAQYYAEVVQADWQLDLAVLRIVSDLNENPVDPVGLKLPAVPIGDSDLLDLGAPLLILGYPGIGGGTITLTRGEVSGFTGDDQFGERAFIKTSAVITGGNSGGLVADAQGRLIAVPTQLGYGGDESYVDCRVIADTNRDGQIDELDSCVPTGGFINALRPVNLALPMIEAAQQGERRVLEEPRPDIPLPVGRTMLYSDDFSDPDSGWTSDAYNEGYAGYMQGEYQIKVDQENYLYWGVAKETFGDIVLSVRTRIITPVGDGEYGVICRLRDNDNFYGMSVSEDGWYSIWKVEDGEITYLVDWDYSREIPQYDPARITSACIGNKLTLAINEVVLGEVTDYTFSSGDIGLFGGTWDITGFHIAFDDLEVQSP
jgi:S1-C subfamily serine protease